jgi:phytoene/squalene synthetase
MKDLYLQTCLEASRLITNRYSTSFSLGIKTLHKRFHNAIYAIYGFVRYADEIVDTFHEFDKESLFVRFKADTYKAIEEKISLNPVLHSFQWAVNSYSIDHEYIEAFFNSMEMDLHKSKYTKEGYGEYIYGSAEVVGLMCLRVFCQGNNAQFQHLKASARSLGAAFQKVNFLRDIKSDFQERGRVYFPGADITRFNETDKAAIEADIAKDFEHALEGIKQLPSGAKEGVYLAYIYYLRLFKKIKHTPPAQILSMRIRIPDVVKILLLIKTLFQVRVFGLGVTKG